MRKTLTLILVIATVATVFGQTASQKIIIVTRSPKKVPMGKKWILEANKETKVQLSAGVLKSGTMCNALFFSNPKMVMNVSKGDIYKSEGYAIVFKDPEKVPYTNNVTYTLTPIAFVDRNFSVREFQYKKPEEVGVKQLVFFSGENVFVGDCLQSIEMIEVNMTIDDLKRSEIEKDSSFCIRFRPEKGPLPGTKPALKDSLIKSVIFYGPEVIFYKGDTFVGSDWSRTWTITLTQTTFKIQCSKGKGNNFVLGAENEKSYSVLRTKYDDKLMMQEFQIADEQGRFIYKLNLCWDGVLYDAGFRSVNNKDIYYFKSMHIQEIKYQNK